MIESGVEFAPISLFEMIESGVGFAPISHFNMIASGVRKWDKYTQNIISEFKNMNKTEEEKTHCSEEQNIPTEKRKTKHTYNINKILCTANTIRTNHDVAIGSGNL